MSKFLTTKGFVRLNVEVSQKGQRASVLRMCHQRQVDCDEQEPREGALRSLIENS